MEEKLSELKEKINAKRDELNFTIEKGGDKEEIYKINAELDELIAEYIKCENQLSTLSKYNHFLNASYREEIINSIKNDVKKQVKDISDYELECYCTNIYVYGCLKAYNISKDEIAKQILYRNNIAAEKLEGSSNINISLKFNTDISNKYYEILKQRIKEQKSIKNSI